MPASQNDGFGGGDNITENVLFHTCRESSDHGPIKWAPSPHPRPRSACVVRRWRVRRSSWDRQPFVTTVRTGKPSTRMEWRHVHNNIVIANYGGSKQVDNDDGGRGVTFLFFISTILLFIRGCVWGVV